MVALSVYFLADKSNDESSQCHEADELKELDQVLGIVDREFLATLHIQQALELALSSTFSFHSFSILSLSPIPKQNCC
jgi:hypothetical protein